MQNKKELFWGKKEEKIDIYYVNFLQKIAISL
jgi:hypothetical protein